MVAVVVLLVILIVVASIPAIVGIFLGIRIYQTKRRYYAWKKVTTKTGDSPTGYGRPTDRKQCRKPYQLEEDDIMSLEELASEITPHIEGIGEGWRTDNEWDNVAKIKEDEVNEQNQRISHRIIWRTVFHTCGDILNIQHPRSEVVFDRTGADNVRSRYSRNSFNLEKKGGQSK